VAKDKINQHIRDERVSREIDAEMSIESGDPKPITIENLSRHGLQARADELPAKGDAVLVTIAEIGEYEGVVRWVTQEQFEIHIIGMIGIDRLQAVENVSALRTDHKGEVKLRAIIFFPLAILAMTIMLSAWTSVDKEKSPVRQIAVEKTR